MISKSDMWQPYGIIAFIYWFEK